MKTLKSLVVISILFISSIAYSQPPGGGQRGHQQGPPPLPNDEQIEQMVQKLSDAIALSSEQEGQVLKLYQQHFEILKKNMQSNTRPNRNEMEKTRSDLEENVKEVLSPFQRKMYNNFLKNNEKRPPRRQER